MGETAEEGREVTLLDFFLILTVIVASVQFYRAGVADERDRQAKKKETP